VPWLLFFLFALLVATSPARAQPRPSALASYDASIEPAHRKHWAFQRVQTPAVPLVKNPAWVRNPIDAFVLARLEAQGWKPAPAAEPRAFLRRLYLDLLGLPPTPAEQEASLKNSSPEAFDRTVEDLLARPSYGERWARHWLDLVRYAETNGYERDADKPSVWRYRDYVIRAFNADTPFNRFILEQLAGDELPDASPETLLATGYYRLGPWDDEPADPREDRFDQLDDMVGTTAQVFLGLTLGCARCHNHKFEPLTQHDYYRMVAIFAPLQRPQNGRTELDLPIASPAQVAATTRITLSHHLAAIGAVAGTQDPFVAAGHLAESQKSYTALPRGYCLHEPSPHPPPTHLLKRGKASQPGPLVEPGMPAVLVSGQPVFPSSGKKTSLRRLTLARWIASPDNPLTARVLVNRIWQYHFGEGLVRTPSDFGIMGEPPTNRELLDWLADWFVRGGWSIKRLHRLILASNTYRMSKQWNPEYGSKDPEDRLLWRVPYRRLDVEAIRDSMLAVSGQLNPKMFGPSVYLHVPREALASHSDPDKIWKPFDEIEASRRTVYALLKRSLIVPMLETLDLCDTARTSAKRMVTTVPPQALTLFNGDFANRQARHLAERLGKEVGNDPEACVERAYRLALCRPPSPTERHALVEFLKQETDAWIQEAAPAVRPGDAHAARRRALQEMCRVIFNLNEFVYTD
jgi:hypothetical protein